MALGLDLKLSTRALLGGARTPSGPVTALALTAVPDQKVFQRAIAQTVGSVALAGTFSGGNPTNVEAQILTFPGNAIVKDWTVLGGATIAGGAWSGTLTGVAQGGPYYAKVRASNVPAVGSTGATNFYMGMVFILYGQSNMGGFISAGLTPPAAAAGTSFYDKTTGWGAVPAANGVREFLNAVKTASGVPCAAICGAITGSTIGFLADETPSGGAGQFYTQMAAAGVLDGEMCVFMQGEGNANTIPATSEISYKTAISDLHAKLCTHFSRTKAQFNFIQAGLTTYGGAAGADTDATWSTIRTAQFHAAQEQPNVYLSHSNMDGVRTDTYHLDPASQGRAGQRYAQTVKFLLGLGGGIAHFEITSGAVIDATHTNVTIAHSSGATDFTPVSAATGFEVSGDNGANWSAPTGTSRIDGSTIQLTHASLATNNQRKLRYQYGMLPNVSAPIKDNGALALPLTFTPDIISPTPLASLPLPTFIESRTLTGATQIQTASGIPIGAAAPLRYLIFGAVGVPGNGTLTVTPNVGSVVTATLIKRQGTVSIYGALLLADANTATTVSVSLDYGVNPFGNTLFDTWTVPSSDMTSTTPVGSNGVTTAAGSTVGSTPVATTSGGFIVAISRSDNTANSGTISGTETFAQRINVSAGIQQTAADASGVATNAASTVTTTYTAAGTIDLAAVSWR